MKDTTQTERDELLGNCSVSQIKNATDDAAAAAAATAAASNNNTASAGSTAGIVIAVLLVVGLILAAFVVKNRGENNAPVNANISSFTTNPRVRALHLRQYFVIIWTWFESCVCWLEIRV